MKRFANVPTRFALLGESVSKADLLEAAYHLAAISNGSERAENDNATFRRLVEELNIHRAARGMGPLKVSP